MVRSRLSVAQRASGRRCRGESFQVLDHGHRANNGSIALPDRMGQDRRSHSILTERVQISLVFLDQIRISIVTMLPEEHLQRSPVFLNECLVCWVHRILTSGLLDGSSVLLDLALFPVMRF